MKTQANRMKCPYCEKNIAKSSYYRHKKSVICMLRQEHHSSYKKRVRDEQLQILISGLLQTQRTAFIKNATKEEI